MAIVSNLCGYFLAAFLLSSVSSLPASKVLSPDFKVIEVLERNDKIQFHTWSPTQDDFNQDIDEIKERVRQNRNTSTDYVEHNIDPVNYTTMNTTTEYTEGIVELSIICDRAFSAQFGYDRRKIVDYWTAYMWEVNLLYKTLPSTNLSILVTSVLIISTPWGQPFIDNAKNEEGKVSYNRILPLFADFMYTRIGIMPQFDAAMAVTNEPAEWYGGLAYLNAACKVSGTKFLGSFVMSDDGVSMHSMYIASHELGHVLGAPHDDEIEWCAARKYIMSGGDHFFSPCSDITINNYVRSNSGACVRNVTHLARPAVDPDFNSVPVNTTLQQCQRWWKNESAFIEKRDIGLCSSIPCKLWRGSTLYITKFNAIGNSPCGENGHCFRGRCLSPGNLIVNSGSGKCMRSSNRFTYDDTVQMVPCPSRKSATPLDMFVLNRTLASPYSVQEDTVIENDEKCLIRTGSLNTGYELKFDRCSSESIKETSWSILDAEVGTDEVILLDAITQQCVKQEGDGIVMVSNCHADDSALRWRLE